MTLIIFIIVLNMEFFLLVIYTILKTLPDTNLANKDLIYVMGILTIGFI